jgi:hypothetical protein
MGIIKDEDIVGYRLGEQIVHPQCATPDELNELEEDMLITEHEIEKDDDLWFCDRCRKQMG